ncbi:MAG: hypothetical protein PV344_06515 [Anaplasma sp.]|nr:hypothetical protein [Anaplasma sp.]
MVHRVMTSQPHDLAREFQTTHSTHVKRDVTRGMKAIKRRHVMRIRGRHMSQMISLYKVTYLAPRKIGRVLSGIRTHDPSVESQTRN